jgi:succinyl-CoA synthetase beta subunit
MRFYEYEAKKVFEKEGIPVPRQYGVIHSPDELENLDLVFPVMLKAMVLVGGRGKAGGIKKVENLEEAKKVSSKLLQLNIKDYPVEMVLVEEAVREKNACYVGVTVDPASFNNVVIVSASGGVDIEEVAKEKPEMILRKEVLDNSSVLPHSTVEELADFLIENIDSGNHEIKKRLMEIISKLYEIYQKFDLKICEINPLILTDDNQVVAADAKMILDDNAMFRQAELLRTLGVMEKRHDVAEPTKNEIRAQKAGFPYVDLLPENAVKDPNKLYVGLVPGGAGYGIFSIDEVANIGGRFFDNRVVPVNFMDSGGGPPQHRVAEMFHLLMDHPLVDLVITSRFGGISSCDIFIRGLIQALRERYEKGLRVVPVYGRMVGTDLPSARAYLEKAQMETPEALERMTIIVGNQKIMADVIYEAIEKAFKERGWKK